MLILSRKKNESIVINDSVTITIVEIRGDKVRLGIEAPREMPIHRKEVFDAIQSSIEKSRERQIHAKRSKQFGCVPDPTNCPQTPVTGESTNKEPCRSAEPQSFQERRPPEDPDGD